MSVQLEDDFRALETALQKGMERTTRKSATRAQKSAKVPVDTGELRDSAHIGETLSVDGQSATTIDYEAEYASFVHDGHMNRAGRFVAARPFLTNSLNGDETQLEDDIEHELLSLGCTRVDRF